MKTVFVGLSGGVDSAVTAALLKERGFRVVGAFIKIWQPEFLECTWKEDRLSALRVAAALGIALKEVDLSAEYKQLVVDDMIANYQAGLTPNPDVLCNSHIKFGAFATWAFQNGADYIATGHHAQVFVGSDGEAQLLRGVDNGKDQSYFLWAVPHDVLAKTLMPIGEMQKAEVRLYAEKMHLPNAKRPDSQGLCFVGDVGIRELLSRYIPQRTGEVLNEAGEVIGHHEGAAFYTIGERHGFTITEPTSERTPRYVVAVDVIHNQLVVSESSRAAARFEVMIGRTNWVARELLTEKSVEAVVRYHARPVPSTVEVHGSKAKVTFSDPQVIAPGQSLVLYTGERCVGGGVVLPERG